MVAVYPLGYGVTVVPMAELRRIHEPRMHPEMARRLFAWLESKGGIFGIGGGWRLTQPDKPGVAPDGKSFHQTQTFASGFQGYCAVDLVVINAGQPHRAPIWPEVPAQGSTQAAKWGVHCNVGTPGVLGSEPWHMQPVEIDGYDSWVNAGRRDPVAGYVLPSDPPKPPEATVRYFKLFADSVTVWGSADGFTAYRMEKWQCDARGVDPATVPVLPASEHAKYQYHLNGLPNLSVK
jgi:hypothetical protein